MLKCISPIIAALFFHEVARMWWDDGRGFVEVEESPQGVVEKKRETERFMSDMVIFISRGKKARFHAVGAFIPFSDDKGTESENGECGRREK